MLDRWILSEDGPVELKPVPLESLETLEALLSMARSPEFAIFQDQVAQKILNLHARGDRPYRQGIKLESLLAVGNTIDQLFGPGGTIELINRFVPNYDEDGEKDEYPPFSSGNLRVDYLADLTYQLGSYDQAHKAISCMGVQAIADMTRRLIDLNMGKEERGKRGLKKWFWENQKDFDFD